MIPSYLSHIAEPKIPWSWQRTFKLFKSFFTGIVPSIPAAIIKQRIADWCRLTLKEKRALIDWTTERSTLRRGSMAETATRASYVLVGVALVTGFGGSMIVAPDTEGAAKLLLLLGFSHVIVSTMISILAIAFKAKAMKRPRESGESEADERLRKMVAIKESGAAPSKQKLSLLQRILQWVGLKSVSPMALYEEFEEVAEQLYKRKLVLTVERRAQWIACVIAVAGLAQIGVGMWIR
jgi:hypothetical protein